MNISTINTSVSGESAGFSQPEKLVLIVESSDFGDSTITSKFEHIPSYLIERADQLKSALKILEVTTPDFLVLSVNTVSDVDLAKLLWVRKEKSIPVVIFAREHLPNAAKLVVEAGVSTYIVDDVSPQRLPVILDFAFERFSEIQKVSSELEQTKQKLSDRKLIEKAKGIVMRQKNYTEDEAYMEMRKSAMNQSKTMAELARKIISLFDEMLD